MPTNLYRVRQGSTGTTSGRELLDTLATLDDRLANLQRIFAAMTQQQDDTTQGTTAFVTPATVFGFVDAQDTISAAVAHDAYGELNACLAAIVPALQQCCSRFRQ
jgi:hypothetical protein